MRYLLFSFAVGMTLGCSTSDPTDVDPRDPSSIQIFPGDSVLSPYESATYQAQALNDLAEIVGPVLWSVSNDALASINADGELTVPAGAQGLLYVIARVGRIRDSVPLRITSTWIAVSAAQHQVCALDRQHRTWCWGDARGTTHPFDEFLPTLVETSTEFSGLATGGAAACGISVGSAAGYCWGNQANGKLGIGTANGTTPQPILGGFAFDQVAIAGGHGCGVTTAQQIACWGSDNHGQLGDSLPDNGGASGKLPALIAGSRLWKQVAVQGSRSCGLASDGKAFCWGSYDFGTSGWNEAITTDRDVPTAVEFSGTYQSIVMGRTHQCGLRADGATECWGSGYLGQLGDGSGATVRVPQLVSGSHTFVQLDADFHHTCAVDTDGAAWCWGQGPLGDPVKGSSSTPIRVTGSHQFTMVDVGNSISCGLTIGGALYCWGEENLGDGTGDFSATPVRVRDP